MTDRSRLDIDAALSIEHLEPAPRHSKHEKWCRWLDQIEPEITMIFMARDIWQTVMGIVNENQTIPSSHFFDFVTGGYISMQALAVRRQADLDARVISLARLMIEIIGSPEIVSRPRFVSQFPRGTQWLGHRQFDEYAGLVGSHLDPVLVRQDLDLLRGRSIAINDYVDRRIAHLDKRDPRSIPTFGELDLAIDTIGRLFQRYTTLLTGQDRAILAPIPDYDWLAPFRVPWLQSD